VFNIGVAMARQKMARQKMARQDDRKST